MQEQGAVKLNEFVEASKAKGASDEFLAALLARRGWPVDDVYSALGRYWERATGLSLPARTGASESSREAFFYLLSFSALATWATALGAMLFQFIDHWFPDPVSAASFDLRQAVTWQMASIAIAFPVYLLVMRVIVRETREHPERLRSGVRKWLTYIALLGTAGAMIGDLIWFLDYFLAGELSARFVWKALTVMAISGAIFFYYLESLRANTSKSRGVSFGIGATAAVVAAFCIGLGQAGTPSVQRQVQADVKRVQDLHAIASALKSWHDRAEQADSTPVIPAALNALGQKVTLSAERFTDPETKAQYEYRVISGPGYELCASFATRQPDGQSPGAMWPSWHHDKGRVCFQLDASQHVPW
jgi:hypothetical protein